MTAAAAKNGIKSVKTNAKVASRFERKDAKNGKPYFVLKASNGQVVGTSERYDTEKSCENGIQSVCKNAPGAKIEDLSA